VYKRQELAQEINFDIWGWILAGGEDHVFLATGKDLPGIRIGTVVEGSGISGIETKRPQFPGAIFNRA
jgi:thiamine-monophosphate kinase